MKFSLLVMELFLCLISYEASAFQDSICPAIVSKERDLRQGNITIARSGQEPVRFAVTDRNWVVQEAKQLAEVRGVPITKLRVLDLGSGKGSGVRELRAMGVEAYGIDLAYGAHDLRTGFLFNWDIVEARRLAATLGKFDLIYSSWSLFTYSPITDIPLMSYTLNGLVPLLKKKGEIIISETSSFYIQRALLRDRSPLKMVIPKTGGRQPRSGDTVVIRLNE